MSTARTIAIGFFVLISVEITLKSSKSYPEDQLPSRYIKWGINGTRTFAHNMGEGLREIAAPTVLEYVVITREGIILPATAVYEFVYGLLPDWQFFAAVVGIAVGFWVLHQCLKLGLKTFLADCYEQICRFVGIDLWSSSAVHVDVCRDRSPAPRSRTRRTQANHPIHPANQVADSDNDSE